MHWTIRPADGAFVQVGVAPEVTGDDATIMRKCRTKATAVVTSGRTVVVMKLAQTADSLS
jgi:hypothetical protein